MSCLNPQPLGARPDKIEAKRMDWAIEKRKDRITRVREYKTEHIEERPERESESGPRENSALGEKPIALYCIASASGSGSGSGSEQTTNSPQSPNGRCTPDGKSPTPCAFHSNCQGYCLLPAWIAWILWRKRGHADFHCLSVLAEGEFEAAVSSIPTPRHTYPSLHDFSSTSYLGFLTKLILPETNQTPISSLPTLSSRGM